MECPVKNRQIIPLHTHTYFSVLDSASDIDQYITWCLDNGSPALGISDHGYAIGALELYKKCKKAGLTALPGCEFYVAPDPGHVFAKKPFSYYHVTVWAHSEAGYRNLLKLASLSFSGPEIDGKKRVLTYYGNSKPRITFAELFQYNEGLTVGSGCLIGSAAKCLLQGETSQAAQNLLMLNDVFKGRFYAELMPHDVTHDYSRDLKQFVHNECSPFAPDGDLQKACNLQIAEWSQKHKIPTLLTVDAHFVHEDQHKIQTLLLQNGDPDGWHFKNSYHQKNTEEAWESWQNHFGSDIASQKLFVDSVENQYKIADSAKGLVINDAFQQPKAEIPQDIIEVTEDPKERRKLLTLRLIETHSRMKWDDPVYTARLAQELTVICDNNDLDFSDYFLFLETWSTWCRSNSIMQGIGRGSAGGSLLAYLLKITHIDPIRWNLPFERFLSDARISRKKYPDIDMDFGSRDVIVSAFNATYGDRCAQISTHGTIKVKSAIKDACRVLLGWNSNDKRVDGVTKSVGKIPMGIRDKDFLLGYTDEDGNQHKGHIEQNPKLQHFFKAHPSVYEMVIEILGIPRSIGRHASAMVISDGPISDTVPTCVVKGQLCTQYTAKTVEAAGLIKFDILTVSALKDIGDTIRLIQSSQGYDTWEETLTLGKDSYQVTKGELTLEQVPLSKKGDPDEVILNIYDLPEVAEVFADLAQGKTKSVFQLESDLLTGFCKRIRPTQLSELSDIVALCRPGPLDAEVEPGVTFAEAYIARKAGKSPVTYVHPDMEPIVKNTYGVLVYQEQIQRAFHDLAGYTAEEADRWRELLAKKQKQDVEKFTPELRARLLERGWTDTQAQVFVDATIAASQYSFNLAHSASYGITSYMCAFLKHFFPTQWWAAVLNNCKVEEIKDKQYDHAVKDILVMPHVNGPTSRFDLLDGKVHAPMQIIDGIGDAACRAIKKAIDDQAALLATDGLDPAMAAFDDFQEFYERVDKKVVNSRVFKQLILCGAFELIDERHPKEILRQYYYLQRVSKLKAKNDEGLYARAEVYAKEHPEEAEKEFDLLKKSAMEWELLKLQALPIYRCNVHNKFKIELSRFFTYRNGKAYYRDVSGEYPLLMTMGEVTTFAKNSFNKRNVAMWCGFLRDSEAWQYTDKKTGELVDALKLYVSNAGDSLECVLWPDIYKEYGHPIGDGLVVVSGNIKPGMKPGTFQLFVSSYTEVNLGSKSEELSG